MKYIKYILVFILAFIFIDRVGNQILLTGLNRFFGLHQQSELLIVGHSHVMLATNKEALEKETGIKISKYTREGVNVYDRFQMVKQYLESPYSDSLKFVMYGVDQFSFSEKGLSLNSYKLFYPFMDDPSIEKYVKENTESNWDYISHKWIKLTRYTDALLNSSIRGWRNDYSNYKYGAIDAEDFKIKMAAGTSSFNREITMDKDLIRVFQQTMDLLKSKKIKVILVNTPTIDILSNANPEDYAYIMAFFNNFAKDNDFVEFWDFNPSYASDHSIFFDPIHLNPKGQQLITSELIDRLKKENLK